MKPLGKAYANAKASTGDFKRLPAGGYIVKITEVEDKADKEYLNIVYEVAEGPYKGFFLDGWGQEHKFAHSFVRSYKEKALGMFKGFLKTIDESNGTQFEPQAEKGFKETQLVGKLVGILFGYEEYVNDRGEIRERSRVTGTRSVETIRSGDFKVPELKKLDAAKDIPATTPEGFTQDDDLPF